MYRLVTGTELAALAPDLDRLIDRFPDEWRSFMRSLSLSQRKELRKYLWYRKNPHSDWSFSTATATTIQALNEQARRLYWYGGIRYKQLSLPI
jgi:hypothetical protein